jgi:hypothetical protein
MGSRLNELCREEDRRIELEERTAAAMKGEGIVDADELERDSRRV